MTIRAILRNGLIEPTEPLPPGWRDGQELIVDDPNTADIDTQVDNWAHEIEAAAAAIPAEEHDRFRRALADVETESKQAVRREWGLP